MFQFYKLYFKLIFINLIYALVAVCTKYTSSMHLLSIKFLFGIFIIILLLGIYAILWQQILKKVSLSLAYMFKGTSIIFVLILSVLLFGEVITVWNVVGAVIIIGGIALFAKA